MHVLGITTFPARLFPDQELLQDELFTFFLISNVFLYSDKDTFSVFPYTVISCVILKDEANGRRKDEFSLTEYARNGLIIQGRVYILSQT